MSLLPDRLYPGIQSVSTIVPWSTGSEVWVFKSKIFGNSVHFSEGNKPLYLYRSIESDFRLSFLVCILYNDFRNSDSCQQFLLKRYTIEVSWIVQVSIGIRPFEKQILTDDTSGKLIR